MTDPGGLEGIATVTVTAGRPPVAKIDTPAEGFTWSVGDRVDFTGGANGCAGRRPAGLAAAWRLLLQHCATGQQDCHTHALQSWSGTTGEHFFAPEHEFPSYLELELSATDPNGLSHTVKRLLDPKTVDLTFETAPGGLQLSAGSFSGAAPFTRTVIVGST